MPATNQTVTQWQGDTHVIAIPVVDGNGNNVSLAGASADWWMGKSASAVGADIYIRKSTTDPTQMQITGPDPAGKWTVTIKVLPVDTITIRPGTWYHECRVTDSGGNIGRVTTGQFVLNPSIILP